MIDSTNFVEQVAHKISELGLTAPAILLLEAHKPLSLLGSHLLLVAQPTLDIFAPPHLIRNTADLLSNSEQLEDLIIKLEQKT